MYLTNICKALSIPLGCSLFTIWRGYLVYKSYQEENDFKNEDSKDSLDYNLGICAVSAVITGCILSEAYLYLEEIN